MIPLLPKWHLQCNRPTFYDADAVTMLELASTLHASMNTVIEEYNKLVDNINETVTEFMETTEKDQEVFASALRQEFQDFIDIVNLKIIEMDNRVSGIEGNVFTITSNLVTDAIRNGQFSIDEAYDPETESLNLIFSGGV